MIMAMHGDNSTGANKGSDSCDSHSKDGNDGTDGDTISDNDIDDDPDDRFVDTVYSLFSASPSK